MEYRYKGWRGTVFYDGEQRFFVLVLSKPHRPITNIVDDDLMSLMRKANRVVNTIEEEENDTSPGTEG